MPIGRLQAVNRCGANRRSIERLSLNQSDTRLPTHMNETLKIVAMVLTPCLIIGALLFLLYVTRRHQKLQYFVLMPVLLVFTLRRGFLEDWPTRDYVDLGIVLAIGVQGWWSLFRQQEGTMRDDDLAAS